MRTLLLVSSLAAALLAAVPGHTGTTTVAYVADGFVEALPNDELNLFVGDVAASVAPGGWFTHRPQARTITITIEDNGVGIDRSIPVRVDDDRPGLVFAGCVTAHVPFEIHGAVPSQDVTIGILSGGGCSARATTGVATVES